MYCSNCGKEINEKAVVCIGCGVPVVSSVSTKPLKLKSPQNENAKEMTSLEKAAFWCGWAAKVLLIAAGTCLLYAILTAAPYVSISPNATQYYNAIGRLYFDTIPTLLSFTFLITAFLTAVASLVCICVKGKDIKALFNSILLVVTTFIIAIVCMAV